MHDRREPSTWACGRQRDSRNVFGNDNVAKTVTANIPKEKNRGNQIMVEATLAFICTFTVFYGVTCLLDEIEERRRVNRGLEMLRKERLARLERLKHNQ